MATLHFFGDIALTPDELKQKSDSGELKTIVANSTKKTAGIVTRGDSDSDGTDLVNAYTPIGIGKPLSIEILSVYTGDPENSKWKKRTELLVVSAVKCYSTFGASLKAINLMCKIKERQRMQFGAITESCKVVYYAPALDTSETICTFQMIADTFNNKTADGIKKLFSFAGNLPVFASKASLLLGSSLVTGIVDKIGAVVESQPFLEDSESFTFGKGGLTNSFAHMILMCNNKDQVKFNDYKPGKVKGTAQDYAMVHKETGVEYDGDAAYIIINVDGAEKPELESFTPKFATAAILQKFYGAMDKEGQVNEEIEEALMLYNDFRFLKKAKEMHLKMADMTEEDENYEYTKELLEAYKKNIKNEDIKILAAPDPLGAVS